MKNTHLILWFFMTFLLVTTQAHRIIKKPSTKSIYDVLESKGLPMGLFPKGVKNFTVSEDGMFSVHLDQPCDAKFESELHYEKNVIGQLSFGQIGNLTGISAQDLFLWFPVKGIRVDVPSSGVIYFDVGVVRKQFSLSLFETPRDCVAAIHPGDGFAKVTNGNVILMQKLGGVLRSGLDWWRNGVAMIM